MGGGLFEGEHRLFLFVSLMLSRLQNICQRFSHPEATFSFSLPSLLPRSGLGGGNGIPGKAAGRIRGGFDVQTASSRASECT